MRSDIRDKLWPWPLAKWAAKFDSAAFERLKQTHQNVTVADATIPAQAGFNLVGWEDWWQLSLLDLVIPFGARRLPDGQHFHRWRELEVAMSELTHSQVNTGISVREASFISPSQFEKLLASPKRESRRFAAGTPYASDSQEIKDLSALEARLMAALLAVSPMGFWGKALSQTWLACLP